MRKLRVGILLGVISFGVYKGGPFGAFYAFIGFGILLMIAYMVFDCFHAVASFMHSRPVVNYTTNNNLNIDAPARRGQPDSEEWAAIIEQERVKRRFT
jgi:hypothetical protein